MDFYVNYECCKHCSNNPANNPNAGPCCCSLPYMTTTTGSATNKTYTYGTTTTYDGYVPKFTSTTQG